VSTLNEIAANFARLATELDLSKQVKDSETERIAALKKLVEACDEMIDSAKERQSPSHRQISNGHAPLNWRISIHGAD